MLVKLPVARDNNHLAQFCIQPVQTAPARHGHSSTIEQTNKIIIINQFINLITSTTFSITKYFTHYVIKNIFISHCEIFSSLKKKYENFHILCLRLIMY